MVVNLRPHVRDVNWFWKIVRWSSRRDTVTRRGSVTIKYQTSFRGLFSQHSRSRNCPVDHIKLEDKHEVRVTVVENPITPVDNVLHCTFHVSALCFLVFMAAERTGFTAVFVSAAVINTGRRELLYVKFWFTASKKELYAHMTYKIYITAYQLILYLHIFEYKKATQLKVGARVTAMWHPPPVPPIPYFELTKKSDRWNQHSVTGCLIIIISFWPLQVL